MTKKYHAIFDTGNATSELDFFSDHRAGSKANREDAEQEGREAEQKGAGERSALRTGHGRIPPRRKMPLPSGNGPRRRRWETRTFGPLLSKREARLFPGTPIGRFP